MLNTIKKGFQYAFAQNRQLRDDSVPRAGFVQFQTYPENHVQGGGQLVGGVVPGNVWRVTQHPQVIQNLTPVPSSALAGGTLAGTVVMQPLIDTSNAVG